MKILRILCVCLLASMMTIAEAQNVTEVVDSVKAGLKSSSVKEAVSKVKGAFEAKVAKADSLIGTWKYKEPAVISTSKKVIRKAAGNAMSGQLEKLMRTYIEKSGITPENTTITFHADGTFTRSAVKRELSGAWLIGGERLVLGHKNIITADLTTRMEDGELVLLTEIKRVLEIFKALGGVPDNTFVRGLEKISKLAPNLKCGFVFEKK